MDKFLGPEYLDPTKRYPSKDTDLMQDFYQYKNLVDREKIVESKTKKQINMFEVHFESS